MKEKEIEGAELNSRRREKVREEKNSRQHQTRDLSGPRTTPLYSERQYFSNIILEDNVWWSSSLTCVARIAQ